MPLFYPSFDALRLADTLIGEIGGQTPGYLGRIGAYWYWRLPAGILVVVKLDHSVTEERWDVVRAEASTPRSGIFSTAEFPFKAYATSTTTPPFIHDLQGVAEWSNRLYFQMGRLIEDCILWLETLHAIAISPQVSPAAALPGLSSLVRQLVTHAVHELEGRFQIKALHEAFRDEISQAQLRKLAQNWEARELLEGRPRRVTYALRVLAEEYQDKPAP
jgi:hypothetical protein